MDLTGLITKSGGFLRRHLTTQGLITVPGAFALAIWIVAICMTALDRIHQFPSVIAAPFAGTVSYDTAVSVLSTIAATSITALSLVYSLVLVVFTLAAGTIAPRLLKRFTRNRVSQVTAGLLGGTFLFSLTALSGMSSQFVPVLSVDIAFMLAALSVLQLIYFVHTVSVSVMIDEEIAVISRSLNEKMAKLVRADQEAERRGMEMPECRDLTVTADASGFLSAIDSGSLTSFAAKHDLAIDLQVAPGSFVGSGEPIAQVKMGASGKDEAIAAITKALTLTPAREDMEDAAFSLNLLLEIALRALSPGVNDTFTAIACVNRMADALVGPVSKGIRENIHIDDSKTARLRIPGLRLEDLLAQSLRPVRQAASGNHLMLSHLAGVIRRLSAVARDKRTQNLLREQAREILAAHTRTDALPSDLESLRDRLSPVLGHEGKEREIAGASDRA